MQEMLKKRAKKIKEFCLTSFLGILTRDLAQVWKNVEYFANQLSCETLHMAQGAMKIQRNGKGEQSRSIC